MGFAAGLKESQPKAVDRNHRGICWLTRAVVFCSYKQVFPAGLDSKPCLLPAVAIKVAALEDFPVWLM